MVLIYNGGMPERSNGQSWKDCVLEMVPRVRISLPPQNKSRLWRFILRREKTAGEQFCARLEASLSTFLSVFTKKKSSDGY